MKTKLEKLQANLQDLREKFEKPQKREYTKKISFCSRGEIKQLKNSYKEKFYFFDERDNLTAEEKIEKKEIKRKYDFFDSLFDSENFAEDKAKLRDTKEDFEVDLYQMVHFLELPLEDCRKYYYSKLKDLDFIIEKLEKIIETL